MKIEIKHLSDDVDCETCGGNWASGAEVLIDGVSAFHLTPYASCLESVHYDTDAIYKAILAHLGHEVVESC